MRKLMFTLAAGVLLMAQALVQAAPSGYCDSYGRNTYYFWQQALTIGDVYIPDGNSQGYIYIQNGNIDLEPGLSTITLTPGYRSYNYTVYWRGWLDLNGDMEFSEDEVLFSTSSRSSTRVNINLPEVSAVEQTTLRIAMKYGSYPQPCEAYSYGETEDFLVTMLAYQPEPEPVVLEDSFHLIADPDFTLHRSGALGDNVSWVVEKNGSVVLQRSAASEVDYRYYSNTAGSDIRVWLQQYIDGSYQRVSNIIEYTPGQTDQYQLDLGVDFELTRSGELGDDLTWVIERDGNIELERYAANELNYIYFNNVEGSHYRVWLTQFMNGQYEIVSNTVEYQVGQTEFTLTLDPLNQVRRNGQLGDQVSWVVEENGQIIVNRGAKYELTYGYENHQPGSSYRVWLEMFVDGQYQVVSNVVEYDEPLAWSYQLTLGSDYTVNRSGELGEALTWVIVKDGNVVLQRNAANELSYLYSGNTDGSHFQIYLHKYTNGYYQRVSNIVEYTVGEDPATDPETFTLSVDAAYGLTRSGALGDPLTWVIERDGQIVLERNAANELAYTYFNNVPGSSYRVWLEMFVEGQYQVVSNVVEYSVPDATGYDYKVSVDANYRLTRSGALGDALTWVIIKDGNVVLQRNAANELSYTYFSNTTGSTIQVYLKQYINGAYQQVSNMVQYTVK